MAHRAKPKRGARSEGSTRDTALAVSPTHRPETATAMRELRALLRTGHPENSALLRSFRESPDAQRASALVGRAIHAHIERGRRFGAAHLRTAMLAVEAPPGWLTPP